MLKLQIMRTSTLKNNFLNISIFVLLFFGFTIQNTVIAEVQITKWSIKMVELQTNFHNLLLLIVMVLHMLLDLSPARQFQSSFCNRTFNNSFIFSS
jgi:hypothetical protein